MDPSGIVVVDRSVDRRHKLAEIFASCRISQIKLELSIEGFLVPVFPRAAGMGTGDEDAEIGEYPDERLRLVLSAVVRVEDRRMRMVEERIAERLDHKRRAFADGNRDTDDLAGVQIEYGRDVDPSALKPHFGEVSGPDMVGVAWHCRSQEIGVDRRILWFTVLFCSSPASRFDAKLHMI